MLFFHFDGLNFSCDFICTITWYDSSVVRLPSTLDMRI